MRIAVCDDEKEIRDMFVKKRDTPSEGRTVTVPVGGRTAAVR